MTSVRARTHPHPSFYDVDFGVYDWQRWTEYGSVFDDDGASAHPHPSFTTLNFVCMIGIDGLDMAEMMSGSASDDKRASANTPTSVVFDVE